MQCLREHKDRVGILLLFRLSFIYSLALYKSKVVIPIMYILKNILLKKTKTPKLILRHLFHFSS